MDCDAKLFDVGAGKVALEILRGCEAFAGDVTCGEGEGDKFCSEWVGA